MEALTNISNIKNLLKSHGFTFSKTMGQNFLINPAVCPKMANLAIENDNHCVLEIGPGIGVLTKELCLRAKKVVAVELDKRLLPILNETLSNFENLKIINSDVMELDLKKLIEEEFVGEKVSICANLPYYITSPILMKILESELNIESVTVMVQKEAAKRICAVPGQRECGAITAAVHYYAKPEIMFHVSRGSFMPAPNVDSSVIRLSVLKQPPISLKSKSDFFRLIKAAFGQRRKTILNSLSAGLGLGKDDVLKLLERAGIEPNLRAEQLTLSQFSSISNSL